MMKLSSQGFSMGGVAGLQKPLHQGVMHFLFGADSEKVFFHTFAGTQALHIVVRQQFLVHPFRSREHPHAAFAKSFEQGTVFELAHDAWSDAMLFKPVVQAGAHRGVCPVGSSTGTSARLAGNFFLADLTQAAVPYQDTGELPKAWL